LVIAAALTFAIGGPAAAATTPAPGASASPSGLETTLQQIQSELNDLRSRVGRLNRSPLTTLSPIIAALIVAGAGALITMTVSRRQEQKKLEVSQVQAVPPLLTYLATSSPDEQTRMASAALCRLGHTDLVSDIFAARGGQVGIEGLRRVESSDSAPQYHETVTACYTIAATDAEPDLAVVDFTIAAKSDKQPVRWRRIGIGATPDAGGTPTFDAARFKPEVTKGAKRHTLEFETLLEEKGQLQGRIVFHPPVTSERLEWRYRYEWKGLWTELRKVGKDGGTYAIGTSVESITLRFAFPPTMNDPQVTVVQAGGGRQPLRPTRTGRRTRRSGSPGDLVVLEGTIKKPSGVISYEVTTKWPT